MFFSLFSHRKKRTQTHSHPEEVDWDKGLYCRPEKENWEVDSSRILGQSLGRGKFIYDPFVLETIFCYTRLRIESPSNIPPLIMAPFEILRGIRGINELRVNAEIMTRSEEVGMINEEARLNSDEARNLTFEIAVYIRSNRARCSAQCSQPNLGDPEEDRFASEEALCNYIRFVLRKITCNALGSDWTGRIGSGESFRALLPLTEPQGPGVSNAEKKLAAEPTNARDGTMGDDGRFSARIGVRNASSVPSDLKNYYDTFRRRDCRLKNQLLNCIHGDGSMKVVKMAPDLSSVMFHHGGSDGQPVIYLYLHSGRGMHINEMNRPKDFGKSRTLLRYRRGAWEAPCRFYTALAWTYAMVSLGISIYRCYLKREEDFLEAIIAGAQILTILLITVFGFIKLYVYDDSVLFRLMIGWKAMNTRESMLKYFYKHKDPDVCEAMLAKDSSVTDEQFSKANTSAHRNKNKTGSIRLEGIKDEYLGLAGYIGFGCVIIDCVCQDIILVRQDVYGMGHFEKRADLTAENVTKFLKEGSEINDSGERELVTRRMIRYI